MAVGWRCHLEWSAVDIIMRTELNKPATISNKRIGKTNSSWWRWENSIDWNDFQWE